MIFYCLRLGVMGFGGPLAIIAMIQRDCVGTKRPSTVNNKKVATKNWLSEEEFFQALPVIKMMPGPVAWQTLLYVLRARFGIFAALLGGFFFILPSFVLMVLLAHYYAEFRTSGLAVAVLDGMQVGAFLLILVALKPLSKNYLQAPAFFIFLLLSAIPIYMGVSEPLIILGMGLVAVLSSMLRQKFLSLSLPLFWICFKAGALAFGTGLAIVPLLEGDFVQNMKWLSHTEFMDALAFGQLTPGPVVITVTFIGYKLAGLPGALLATLGIFLPSTIHILSWFPRFMNFLRKQRWIENFLLGAIAAIAAGILHVLLPMALQANKFQVIIFCALGFILWKWQFPSWKLIVLSGLLGMVTLL